MDDRHDALEELAAAVRRLNEATVETGEAADVVRDVAKEVTRLAERLEASQDENPWTARSYAGVEDFPRLMGINPTIGRCSPLAPQTTFDVQEDGSITGGLRFGLAHVGPPERVHGGMVAAFLDQALGAAAITCGQPGFTARLTVHYRRATPLRQDLRWEASAEPAGERRSHGRGAIYDADGTVLADAEALFVSPRGDKK